MKKIILILAIYFMVTPTFALAEELTLDNRKLVEEFGANIFKEKLDSYDPKELGLWYLKRKYHQKWDSVKNDEFEFDDTKIWAFEQLKKRLESIEPIDKKAKYHLYLSASFGKYDFKQKRFPIKRALTKRGYMSYWGQGEFVFASPSSNLMFANIDESVNYIPMEKEKAKAFVKSRKDKYGNVARDILAHYIYTIINYKEKTKFKSNGEPMTINFKANLESVEFMSKDKKTIFHKSIFSKSDPKEEEKKSVDTKIAKKREKRPIKWIKVDKDKCQSQGGEIKEGICNVNWHQADKICKGLDARVPKIADFKDLVQECNGSLPAKQERRTLSPLSMITSSVEIKNIKNIPYQRCLKKHAIPQEDVSYWSDFIGRGRATRFSFNRASERYINADSKREMYVVCVE